MHTEEQQIGSRRTMNYLYCRSVTYSTLLFLLSVLLQPACANSATPYAIFYPKLHNNYQAVFQNIIQGIESTAGNAKFIYSVDSKGSTSKPTQMLAQNKIKLIVALGSTSYDAANTLPNPPPILISATPTTHKNTLQLSLSPDPKQLLERLTKLAPNIQNVTIVYNPDNNEWFIDKALQAAQHHNLTIKPIPIQSIKQASQAYEQFFNTAKSATDALLLPLDRSAVHETIIMPQILENAWDKHILVFSCYPSHAQRGVAFSAHPNNHLLGQNIGRFILSEHNYQNALIHPLQQTEFALNLSTIRHLGLAMPRQMNTLFSAYYPK